MDFISVHEYNKRVEDPNVWEVRREVIIPIESIIKLEEGSDNFTESHFSEKEQHRFGIGSCNSRILTNLKDENGNIIKLFVCESLYTIKNKIELSGQYNIF